MYPLPEFLGNGYLHIFVRNRLEITNETLEYIKSRYDKL